MLPTMAGLIILNIIPIIQTALQSFYQAGDFGQGNTFVGLSNFAAQFRNAQVGQSVLNTFAYALIEVPLSIFIAFIMAVMLNQPVIGRAVFRTIFFLPMVAAPAAVAMVWRWLYNNNFGLLNHILSTIGLRPAVWVSNPQGAIGSIAVIGIWSCVGYNMVLLLAGLQEIPRDFYEAASIDGAGIVRQQLMITVPLLSPTIYFVSVTRIIAAMQVFDLIFMVMDKANPALPKTQSLVYLFYQYSFVENNKGYGAAIVILLLIIILILTGINQFIQNRWVHYG
ncbi:MAG: sugar ABC transporter permease [Treponema sp.]|nr:sugar ABC transporter permease [Treponema sp.]